MTVLDDAPAPAEVSPIALNAAQARLAAAVGELLQPSRVDLPGRQGEVPSLLDQLADAVHSTQGGGGAGAGVHRWHYGVDAAQLLAEIDRTVRPAPARQAPYRRLAPTSTTHRPRAVERDLARMVRSWAGLAGFWRTSSPSSLFAASASAERWVAQAREVLSPRRRLTAVGACPRCEQAMAYVLDGAGERVRRPALEIDIATGETRCLVAWCDGVWPVEQAGFLASLLEQQATEKRAGAQA